MRLGRLQIGVWRDIEGRFAFMLFEFIRCPSGCLIATVCGVAATWLAGDCAKRK